MIGWVKNAGGKIPRRLQAVVPPQEREKQVQNLAVPEDNPMLQAVLCVIRGNREIAVLNAAEPKKNDVKPGFYDGGMAMAMQIEEDLLEMAAEGRAAKEGGKKK